LRHRIVNLYGAYNSAYEDRANDYRDLLLDASDNIFNTRFEEFWSGPFESWQQVDSTYSVHNYEENFRRSGEEDIKEGMVPLDFQKLKKDQEYIYFLKTQRNKHYWWMERNITSMYGAINTLLA